MEDTQQERPINTDTASDHEELVRANIRWMLALAERLLRDRGLAEDVVQESFVRAFDGLANFEGRSRLESWLHRITVNTTLSKLRQVKRLAEQSIDEHLPEFDRHDFRIELPWSHLASVEEVMESDDLRRRVYGAIDELPDAYRVVLQLRDIEEHDTSEVAALLDITETNENGMMRRLKGTMLKRMHGMITCREFEEFVLQYLDGELPPKQVKIFEWHLRICRDCREYLAAYKRTVEIGKAALGSVDESAPGDVPEDLIRAVLDAQKT